MATIGLVLGGIKQQLDLYLPQDQIHLAFGQLGYRFRNRRLPPAQSVHLLCIQLLTQVALENLRHVADLADLSAQAIAKARQRLPLALLLALIRQVSQRIAAAPGGGRFYGHRIILADGTTLLAADTKPIASYSGKTGGHGHNDPRIGLLALIDYASGMIIDVLSMPKCRHEICGLHRLLKFLRPGDLILADRGLVNYALLALMSLRGLEACLRLHPQFYIDSKARRHGRRIKRFSRHDHLVCWQRGKKACRWMSLRRFSELPESLVLRQLEYQIIRPGFKTTRAWLITTLVDPEKYPAGELVRLYEKRWQIEECFRNIKSSLKMQGFRAKTLPGIRKEIAGMVLIYNLVRQVMQKAAENQGVSAERVSFKNALYWLIYARAGQELARLKVNPKRTRPSEPRMLKRTTIKYRRLKVPRKNLQLPPPIYQFAGFGLS
jgi:hypothetical protein